MALFTNFKNVEENILDRNYSRVSEILLFGNASFNEAKKTSNIIQYIFDTEIFNDPLSNLQKKLQKFENIIY